MKKLYLIVFLLYCIPSIFFGQDTDTVARAVDSLKVQTKAPLMRPLDRLLRDNRQVNAGINSIAMTATPHHEKKQSGLFYLLVVVFLFFGIVKTVYPRYFATLFRVFFNSSLRQSQLTDQLLQSKLPSVYYNLIFIISAGLFAYLSVQKIYLGLADTNWMLLGLCVTLFFLIYLFKFILLQFVGWVTGNSDASNTYIFIVFLINKIIGICLLPAVVILAFSRPVLAESILLTYLVVICIFMLMRYYRAYSLLQHKIGIGYFHFLIFIVALEILPVVLLYKAAEVFIVKNL